MALTFKEMKIEDIISWCKANNQVEWLKATAAKQTEYKAYPKVTTTVTTEDGKTKKVTKIDKSQPYTIKTHPITFVELKAEFIEKFMPELAPKAKAKKPSFHADIANL